MSTWQELLSGVSSLSNIDLVQLLYSYSAILNRSSLNPSKVYLMGFSDCIIRILPDCLICECTMFENDKKSCNPGCSFTTIATLLTLELVNINILQKISILNIIAYNLVQYRHLEVKVLQ